MDAGNSLVLLVEPHDDTRVLLTRFLKAWGWRVVVASDGRRALRIASHCRPDLALIDTALPDTVLDDLVQCMRAVHHVPLIATTTAPSTEFRRYQAMPFHRVLLKPYTLEALRDALRTAMRRRHACACA